METATLFVHIAAGCVAILAGYVAIFAGKGAELHRRSGTLFAAAMVAMGVFGTAVAIIRDIPGSRTGGLLAAYFVITAMTTIRPVDRRYGIAMLTVPLYVGALSFAGAAEALSQGRFALNGVPVPMILLFGTLALLAARSDIQVLRGALPAGPRRIRRHLWRMCFAFFTATGSFFLGQMDEFPAFLQKPALMAVPALLPLVLMFYWLWRVRSSFPQHRRPSLDLSLPHATTGVPQ